METDLKKVRGGWLKQADTVDAVRYQLPISTLDQVTDISRMRQHSTKNLGHERAAGETIDHLSESASRNRERSSWMSSKARPVIAKPVENVGRHFLGTNGRSVEPVTEASAIATQVQAYQGGGTRPRSVAAAA